RANPADDNLVMHASVVGRCKPIDVDDGGYHAELGIVLRGHVGQMPVAGNGNIRSLHYSGELLRRAEPLRGPYAGVRLGQRDRVVEVEDQTLGKCAQQALYEPSGQWQGLTMDQYNVIILRRTQSEEPA